MTAREARVGRGQPPNDKEAVMSYNTSHNLIAIYGLIFIGVFGVFLLGS